MGTWGDSILADDDAQDVYEHYRKLFNEGKSHAAVLRELKQDWAETIADSDEGPTFWFAVARAQWEFGELDKAVLKRVEQIEKKGLGLERWREGGPKLLAKREKVVREFLEKIRQPNPKPKKPKAEKQHRSIFQPGDCLAIELSDGKFGAAIVLATDDTHVQGFDWVVYLEWHDAEPPPLDFYTKRRWFNTKLSWLDRATWVLASTYRKTKNKIRHIGNVPLKANDPQSTVRSNGGWSSVIGAIERYYGIES
ncbi:hypothetical protein NA78x_000006 [Anatilimnocola sp. NA78]|uniref:hypothetical protein n=1 Tax=Anatilimnocola sp. NA78 TaxID=3415683 RepID=UPI003CE47AE1